MSEEGIEMAKKVNAMLRCTNFSLILEPLSFVHVTNCIIKRGGGRAVSSYSVMPSQHGRGYRIDVISGNGTRHTMLGFNTEDEVARWIEGDRKRERLMHSTLALDDAD